MDYLIKEMLDRGYERASRLFSIDRYAQVNRRILVRTTAVYREQVEFVESWSLPDRFWLCIAHHQYWETKEYGPGVKEAKRGYRLGEIARDLNVPAQFATMYGKIAKSYHPPASYDSQRAGIQWKQNSSDFFDFYGVKVYSLITLVG